MGRRRVEPLDQESLEARLREVARDLQPDTVMDDLEVRHLARVVTECSLLLTDVYSEGRIARIMRPEQEFLARLVDRLIHRRREGEGEVLYQVRRLPDDVRVIGDKALFDLGLLGLQQVKGYDLEELGSRAYRRAGEVLELLAQDRQLRQFFAENRLLVLPLEEEVVFLRQCSERFRLYAEILKGTQEAPPGSGGSLMDLATRVPLMEAAARVLTEESAVTARETADDEDVYVDAARGETEQEVRVSREQLLSGYERILLFSSLSMERLRSTLDSTVVDQAEAVQNLCDEFSLFAAGTRDQRKPPAYFLVGPTGVGKNHLVESLCRLLEGLWKIEIPVLTIEGPNYTYPSDINELRGATRGFIRSDEEGLLSCFHERSSKAPFSVILVDEIEKAHPHLITFFLSILDRGTTTDNRGALLDFSNCMVFFTSNLGYSDAQQGAAPIGYMDEEARHESTDSDIRRELRRTLKPEFVNRVRMIHFNRLTRSSAERILDLELARITRRYEEMHGLQIVLAASAREELVRRGFSPTFGARHLATTLESICNVEIAKKVRREDRSDSRDRGAMVEWLREIKSGRRPFVAEEVKRRVLELARAKLDYGTVCVHYVDGRFEYESGD